MSAPPKFIKDPETGIRRLNPTWKLWRNNGGVMPASAPAPAAGDGAAAGAPSADPAAPNEPTHGAAAAGGSNPPALPLTDGSGDGPKSALPSSIAPVMANEDYALPVMYSVQEVNQNDGQVSEALAATMNQMEQQNVAASIGIRGGHAAHMQQLETVFAKYEMPVGMLSKLMQVKDYDYIVCLLDDSGSMGCRSDYKDRHDPNRVVSRWQEAIIRLKRLTEILAYIPAPPLEITCLNNKTVHRVQRCGDETPLEYVEEAHRVLDRIQRQGCPGSTPMYERMVDTLDGVHVGSKRLIWVFCDGVPNGGGSDVSRISSLVINRANPKDNPLTFFQCSENDNDVEWMSTVEEVALYCSAVDDFQSESREIVLDQGIAFPFSYGLYLCSCIIGAACPDDLDAMDESAPLTKATIDALTGYTTSSEEYHHYFSEFCRAQKRKVPKDAMGRKQLEYVQGFANLEAEFVKARVARDIPLARRYFHEMSQMKGGGCCCVVQ